MPVGGSQGWLRLDGLALGLDIGELTPAKIVLLLVLALVLFGAKRLPEIGRSLGSGMRAFKDSTGGFKDSAKSGRNSC